MSFRCFGVLLALASIHHAHGHGTVTKPHPRKLVSQTWCPWCVGEHQPDTNPSGQVHHDVRPSSPCMGTVRLDGPYSAEHFGSKYRSVAGEGQRTYSPGDRFEATIVLDADHNGDARWSLCPYSEAETEACFQKYPLSDWVDVHAYWDENNTDDHWKSGQYFPQAVQLPDISFGRATLRWLWVCKYTDEIFLSCIDVDIGSGTPSPPTPQPDPTPAPVPTPVPAPAPGPCSELYAQCGGISWSGHTCCERGGTCYAQNPWYHQCIPGPPTPPPTPSPMPPTPVPNPSPPTPMPGGICSCASSTSWDGSFGQFSDGGSFCQQNFGGNGPFISAGGGDGSNGGWSGDEPCTSGQYTFLQDGSWQIAVQRNQGQGKKPYRAFAYAQFCNGQQYSQCWNKDEQVSFSFSFKTDGITHIGAYVKLLFWTDSGNILGLLPPSHPNGNGQLRLVFFPTSDYPNSWLYEARIEDKSWYHIRIDFRPSTRAVIAHLDGVEVGEGTIPVDMLAATNGPQIGVYSFDYSLGPWQDGFRLWFDDACVGAASGACPSGIDDEEEPTPKPSPTPSTAPAGSPVARHGHLHTSGTQLLDESGQVVHLRGVSLFWSQWGEGSKYYSSDTITWLSEDWNINLVRAAMGVEPDGYLTDPEREKARVRTVVDAAINIGIYVIIDWHDHHAEQHIAESRAFFIEMAQTYGSVPNVLFETFNEPTYQSWSGVIKPYHEEIIPLIRQHSDNLIILGSKTWSQDVDEASQDPVSGQNLAYTLHFYANTHRASLRAKAEVALRNGIPLFVTEWGTCSADGNGDLDLSEAQIWLGFLKQHQISDANWAISDKDEKCASLTPGSSPDGGWPVDDLTTSGAFVRSSIRSNPTPAPTPEFEPEPEPEPTTSEPEPEPEPVNCVQFCTRTNLSLIGEQCGDHKVEESCVRSFISTKGWEVPCIWTGCGCLADGASLLQCPHLASDCSTTTTTTVAAPSDTCMTTSAWSNNKCSRKCDLTDGGTCHAKCDKKCDTNCRCNMKRRLNPVFFV